MRIFHRSVFLLYRMSQTSIPITSQSSFMVLSKIRTIFLECTKLISDSAVLKKKTEIPHTLSKFELFAEKTSAILDVEEERQKIANIEEKYDEFEGINLERGVTGVFDIEEVVQLLQKEKAEDIFVGKIPVECNYADYIVITSGKSTKHMLAICNLIRKIYKKKVNVCNQIPHLEGKSSNLWMALDLGNIILHVFSKEGRKIYDLESLWSVGKEFDTLSQRKDSSQEILSDYSKILISLTPNTS